MKRKLILPFSLALSLYPFVCFPGTGWSRLGAGRPSAMLPPVAPGGISYVTSLSETTSIEIKEQDASSPAKIIDILGGYLSVANNIKNIKIFPKINNRMLSIIIGFFPNLETLHISYNKELILTKELFAFIKRRFPSLKIYISGLPSYCLEGKHSTFTDEGLEVLRALDDVLHKEE
jgi:hypothetical protein